VLISLFFSHRNAKKWRKDHPVGFYARPTSNGDGSSNLFKREAGVINGKKGTDWEGGLYKVRIDVTHDYPSQAPVVTFTPVIFSPQRLYLRSSLS
jgi:ubiquitin-conjugating enzyme E2 I